MLHEINQSQKDKYCTIHLQRVSNIVILIDAEIRVVVTRGEGVWERWGEKNE